MNSINDILETVKDPEVPVLSILDLGVVRGTEVNGDKVKVVITPTYTGCPAMDMIEANIRKALKTAGYQDITVETILSPPWTTDWLSEAGKEKLRAYGIAPPVGTSEDKSILWAADKIVPCPHCDSLETSKISEFGSTACKALFRCKSCLEPFDYFKCH